RARFHRGQIRAMVRFGEALAPDFLGGRNFRYVAFLLFLGSPLHQGRADSGDALEIHSWRRLRAVEFLMVDELLDESRAAATIFFRPMDTHPARIAEFAMPGTAPLEFSLGVRIGKFAVVAPIAGTIVLQPAPEFVSERLVLWAEFKIHGRPPDHRRQMFHSETRGRLTTPRRRHWRCRPQLRLAAAPRQGSKPVNHQNPDTQGPTRRALGQAECLLQGRILARLESAAGIQAMRSSRWNLY